MRRLLLFIGITLFSSAFFFVVGYYAGSCMAYRAFADHCAAEALNDRITASLYSLYSSSEEQESSDTHPDTDQRPDSQDAPEQESSEQQDTPEQQVDATAAPLSALTTSSDSGQLYEARLAGFGTRAAAEHYVKKLAKQNVPSRVVARETLNSRRRKVVWYQVVTDGMPYAQLLNIVALLKKNDRLEGVVLTEVAEEITKKELSQNNA